MLPTSTPWSRRHVAIDVWWEGRWLASTVTSVPVALDRALARATAVTVPLCGVRVERIADGEVVLTGSDAITRRPDGLWQVDTLRIGARLVDPEPLPVRSPLDRPLVASVVLAALLALVGTGSLVRYAPDAATLRAAERTRLDTLRQLSTHGGVHVPSDPPHGAPPAPGRTRTPELPGALPDPREIAPRGAPAAPFARFARSPPPALLPALWTPRLAAQVGHFRAALEAMSHEPIVPATDADRDDHGGLGTVGIGAGGGCPHPEDCPTVAVRVQLGDTWRPRARAVATEALRARAISGGALERHPDPPLDTLAMPDVQRQIRRDALADVVRCYTQRTIETQLPAGRVTVRFAIRADGHVDPPAILQTALHDEPTERCIRSVLAAQVFPASRAGASVVYPFVFSSILPES